MTTPSRDLTMLGDELERAVAAQVHPAAPRLWRRRGVAIPAAVGLVALGTGVAAAAGLFSTDEVQTAVTSTALIFAGTTAHCQTTDHIAFDCTLDKPPTGEEGVSYIKGALYEFAVDNKVAGGCRGEDSVGLRWTCYAGARAVEEGVIGPDLLGTEIPAGVHPVG